VVVPTSSLSLSSLELPEGLRGLTPSELKDVCSLVRTELINSVSRSGGHFASSLGATEITVALHHLFQTPYDKLIWDTGHQCYIHKMLTGRRDQMGSIRQRGGLSGFLRRDESNFDAFGAGHAGTSISAGVGIRVALDRTSPERYVIAIIGDGSLTSGMAFEALNHAGDLGLKRFIVVLNDNDMSISPNVGAVSWLFSRAVTSSLSNRARHSFKSLYRKGYVPPLLYKAVDRAEEAAQTFFATPAMLFESFGFRYIGPIDGNNIDDLLVAFNRARTQDVPVVVHARTTKGKGYISAEDDPISWHAVKPFTPELKEQENKKQDLEESIVVTSPGNLSKVAVVKQPTPPTYTQVFADTMVTICKHDPKVIGITAAMAEGTGLELLRKEVPENFFDVGICEQHAITFAAGLACEGYLPVCAIYSTFLQRGFDQLIHDVCIQNLPVVFALDRAGLVGNDGETHQGQFDISFLRCIPDLVLMAPSNEEELRHLLFTALSLRQPVVIRYPRGIGTGVALSDSLKLISVGKGEVLKQGDTCLLLNYGTTLKSVEEAASELESRYDITSTVVNMRFAKPLDTALLATLVPKHKLVCTFEDNALIGGFGSAVLESINDLRVMPSRPLLRFGISDHFISHASQQEQYSEEGLDTENIIKKIRDELALLPLTVIDQTSSVQHAG
jgi:1-deoxy-D-xylulose-5-phosphate synthase